MNNHGTSYDFINGKTIRKKHRESIPLIIKQRRHIPGMMGMGTAQRIQMGLCLRFLKKQGYKVRKIFFEHKNTI